jgi:competence protein ComFC
MKDRDERMKNMDGVFSYNNETMKQCNNVLLFDDVFTTGATLRSAAAILKRSGITFVWGVTMAR